MKKNKSPAVLSAALLLGVLFAPPAVAEFKLLEVKPRILTAGRDGFNDRVTFSFVEPSSKLRLKIFSLDGRAVEEINYISDGTGILAWDAKSAGSTVAPGVYIYQLEADGRIFSGSIVVAR